jgi:hypothetical protein
LILAAAALPFWLVLQEFGVPQELERQYIAWLA